jgi:hypothetical protein
MPTPTSLALTIATARGPLTHIDTEFGPPTIETARITNVNLEDWTVNAVSLYGSKVFDGVQIMNPYFHFANGEGIYHVPEVGALVWVCKPSDGSMAKEFIMGYQAPFDDENVSYRCNRQTLNPGDIMLRTRDEGFIVLRRGGVVQVGAPPMNQRIYLPIQNYIKDFCENYELNTLGGSLSWLVHRTDEDTDGAVRATASLLVKEKANDPKHVATLTVGSHGEDDPTTLDLVVYDSGLDGQVMKARLTITKEGDVSWQIEKTYTVTVTSDILVESTGGKHELKAAKEVEITAGADFEVSATGNVKIEGATAKMKATGNVDIEGAAVNCGGPGAVPAAKAPNVVAAIMALAGACDSVTSGAATAAVSGLVPQIPAQIAKVK